jgi:hypothetical protein
MSVLEHCRPFLFRRGQADWRQLTSFRRPALCQPVEDVSQNGLQLRLHVGLVAGWHVVSEIRQHQRGEFVRAVHEADPPVGAGQRSAVRLFEMRLERFFYGADPGLIDVADRSAAGYASRRCVARSSTCLRLSPL